MTTSFTSPRAGFVEVAKKSAAGNSPPPPPRPFRPEGPYADSGRILVAAPLTPAAPRRAGDLRLLTRAIARQGHCVRPGLWAWRRWWWRRLLLPGSRPCEAGRRHSSCLWREERGGLRGGEWRGKLVPKPGAGRPGARRSGAALLGRMAGSHAAPAAVACPSPLNSADAAQRRRHAWFGLRDRPEARGRVGCSRCSTQLPSARDGGADGRVGWIQADRFTAEAEAVQQSMLRRGSAPAAVRVDGPDLGSSCGSAATPAGTSEHRSWGAAAGENRPAAAHSAPPTA